MTFHRRSYSIVPEVIQVVGCCQRRIEVAGCTCRMRQGCGRTDEAVHFQAEVFLRDKRAKKFWHPLLGPPRSVESRSPYTCLNTISAIGNDSQRRSCRTTAVTMAGKSQSTFVVSGRTPARLGDPRLTQSRVHLRTGSAPTSPKKTSTKPKKTTFWKKRPSQTSISKAARARARARTATTW